VFFLQRGRLEGTQIVIATARTLKDENVKNRPKPSSGASVASITLVSCIDSKDKKEIKVFQTVTAQIEQTYTEDKKWRNPTKILKRTKPTKRRLAVPKTIQTRE
jgi:hypothetical protein